MDGHLDPGALLDRSYALPHGPRVRLRLAQVRDLHAIGELLRARGADAPELDATRLVRFDPRRRAVICATALIGSSETVMGIGAIDVGASEPELLLADEAVADGLSELLARALRTRAAAIARRSAA